MKFRLIVIFLDLIIVLLSFLFFAWIKPATLAVYIPGYLKPLIFFEIIWFGISLFLEKFNFHKYRHFRDLCITILIANFTILAVVSILIFSFQAFEYSRMIVNGTITLATFLEIFAGYVYFSYIPYPANGNNFFVRNNKAMINANGAGIAELEMDQADISQANREYQEDLKKLIIAEIGEKVYRFIFDHICEDPNKNLIISTSTCFNIARYPKNRFHAIINLKRINDIRRINKFFEAANDKLPNGGIFIDCVETYLLRKQRIIAKYPRGFNWIMYFIDWIIKRVMPKMKLTKKIYFFLTRGENRVLSKAETFGRLYSCGFEIVDEQFIDGLLYFVGRKVKEPVYDYNPTYGPIVRLKRVGKEGKIFNVYKMRTMHAYAEYLQNYVYERNALKEGGKFNNDFRITSLGKVMRKLWLDELPMLVNLVKGNMKIFGVRPISQQYFDLYSEELKQRRIKYRPGLVPPYYVDLPKTLEEIMDSEMRYLDAFEKHPFITDWRYFWKAVYNIVFKNARSQ